MLKATSRKHRIEEERQDKINYENKLLYKKMTAILKHGSGHVSPTRTKNYRSQRNRDDIMNLNQAADSMMLHHGRSVTARPSLQMVKRIAYNNQRDPRKKNLLASAEGIE